jgi:DNA-binding transcriptional MocR family regulator
MSDYRLIADEVAARIADGRLRPGDRLPPQRRFARRHGIAPSTAARVYAELIRRGLAVGEVGRGTFVRAAAAAEPGLAEPPHARVDLELNFPLVPEQAALLAEGLGGMLRPDVLAAAMPPVGAAGTAAAREAVAALPARPGWTPHPDRVLFAGNGRQAIAAALVALVPPGERIGVEELTYPIVKGVAARLGVTLVPLPMDEHGLIPEAVRAAGPLRALYVQPTLHNPLGVTMPDARRAELAGLLRELDLYAVEDGIYTFLHEEATPLAAYAPDHVVYADSLSKRVAPGLTAGFLVAPAALHARLAAALRSGGWTISRFALDAAARWSSDGTVARLVELKRRDAAVRQGIARERLAGFAVQADPQAYHCWWRLPEPWRADTFVAAAGRRGIAVSPGAAFAVTPGQSPNAVRLALTPPADVLAKALDTLAALAATGPEDAEVE